MTADMSLFAQQQALGQKEIETGHQFAPKFDENGVLPVVTTDAVSGDVVMLAYMNAEALKRTLESGEAHYWSRSRKSLWRKGETSGNTQRVVDIRTDCDQDAIWLKVEMRGAGAACHVGYRSCFFRSVALDQSEQEGASLKIVEDAPQFDPETVYNNS